MKTKKNIFVFINFDGIAYFDLQLAHQVEIAQICPQGKIHDNKRQPAITGLVGSLIWSKF